jgi:hypothetical protein
MSIWAPSRIAELKACIDAKLSGGMTAQKMGLRLNQVVGKAHRMGLSFQSTVGHKYSSRHRENRKPMGGDRGWRPMPKTILEQPLAPHEYLMLPLRDLPENGCHFIPGDDRLYCGQPAHNDTPYCKNCCGIVYRYVRRTGAMNLGQRMG